MPNPYKPFNNSIPYQKTPYDKFKNSRTQMNENIRSNELRVLDATNHNLGVLTKMEALQIAKKAGLDLIVTAETASPPVAKIIDYGKWMYAESKKESLKKANDQSTETKILRVSIGIGEGDLTNKAKQGSEWLKEGHRVKIELKLQRRENFIDANFLKERIQRILILFTENYKIAEQIKKIPNGMTMVVEKAKGKIGDSEADLKL